MIQIERAYGSKHALIKAKAISRDRGTENSGKVRVVSPLPPFPPSFFIVLILENTVLKRLVINVENKGMIHLLVLVSGFAINA